MSELTTKQLNDVLMYALQEALVMNEMDAHLYNTLGLEHYKEAPKLVGLIEGALEDIEQSHAMVHHFLCPYCHGPLAGVLAVKERRGK